MLIQSLLHIPRMMLDGEILIPPDPSIASPSDAVDHLLLHIDFSRWISRVGGLVAFIGAIRFALSVKSEDAREQLQAALVMVSGFMIQAAIGNLGVFNMPPVYTDAAATLEFQSILDFIGGWSRRVGALAMLIGAAKELDFLPCGRVVNYYWTDEGGILKAAVTQGWWNYWQENYNASFT